MRVDVVEVPCDSNPLDDVWLAKALDSVRERDEARVVLIDATGGPPKRPAFSARALTSLILFELPVIFAFEGPLAGSLTELALACDIRVCSTDASMKGRLQGNARARTLTDEATALSLYIGTGLFDSLSLLATGLVSSVTPSGGAITEARRIAGVIAARGPIATSLGKEAIWRGLAQPLEQALRFETDLTLLLQTTKDRAEGVQAFLEKRTPVFKGE